MDKLLNLKIDQISFRKKKKRRKKKKDGRSLSLEILKRKKKQKIRLPFHITYIKENHFRWMSRCLIKKLNQ